MALANIKFSSGEILQLKKLTGEKTGQKAVRKAVIYYMMEARQRKIFETLKRVSFRRGFDPLSLRNHER